MFRSISPPEFENEVLKAAKPVFLACLRKDEWFEAQLKALAEVCQEVGGELEFYLLSYDYLSSFWERYGIKGTPTFAIMFAGHQEAILLGRAQADALSKFVRSYLDSRKQRASNIEPQNIEYRSAELKTES